MVKGDPSGTDLEGQSHLMPGNTTVGGAGKTFVDISEVGIERNLMFLAGENDPLTAVGFGIGNEAAHHKAGQSLPLVVGMGGDTENHLPLAGFVAIGGRGEHLIHQVSLFGDGAIDKRDDLSIHL